jgi:hypothetical protein
MALRMGKDGSLDNETAGGIHCYIGNGGYLNGYAVDKYGTKYYEHPNSGMEFNSKIPEYDILRKIVLEIAEKIFFTRIIGLDMCMDEYGNWRAIEINLNASAIRFAQYGGQPFFGEYTDEVVQYCQTNHWALKD